MWQRRKEIAMIFRFAGMQNCSDWKPWILYSTDASNLVASILGCQPEKARNWRRCGFRTGDPSNHRWKVLHWPLLITWWAEILIWRHRATCSKWNGQISCWMVQSYWGIIKMTKLMYKQRLVCHMGIVKMAWHGWERSAEKPEMRHCSKRIGNQDTLRCVRNL